MSFRKTLKTFMAMTLTIAMIVTIAPFVPNALGVGQGAGSENYAYAAADDELAVPFHVTAVGGPCKVMIGKSDSKAPTATFKYAISSDGSVPTSGWTDYTTSTSPQIELAAGSSIYFIAKSDIKALGVYNSDYCYTYLTTYGVERDDQGNYYDYSIKAAGNVMSLLYTDFSGKDSFEKDCALYGLFMNNPHLISAEDLLLPATTLSDACYMKMFNGCNSLVTPPVLPANSLAPNCYNQMFNGCTSLTEIRVGFTAWNVDDNYTYNWVKSVAKSGTFYCPAELPEVEAASSNYFSGIPSGWTITKQPKEEDPDAIYLNFTAEGGDAKIQFMSDLVTPINVEYKIDNGAWTDWTDWDVTDYGVDLLEGSTIYFRAPKGVTEQHLVSDDGSKLTCFQIESQDGTVKAAGSIMSLLSYDCNPDIQLKDNEFYQFFYLCPLSSAPELPATKLAEDCYAWMFQKCNSLTTAPELPATTLAKQCYMGMFFNCESLTTAPELPSKELAEGCYSDMFNGCSNLNEINVGFTDWKKGADTSRWVLGVAYTGTFYCPDGLAIAPGSNGVPEGWTLIKQIDVSSRYITFNGTKATVHIGVDTPTDIVVKGNNGSGSSVSTTTGKGTIEFNYGCDLYKITFKVNGTSYTMHANCKTVLAAQMVDTTTLDDKLTTANSYLAKDYAQSVAASNIIVNSNTESITANPYASASAKAALSDAVASASTVKGDKGSDQIAIDKELIKLNSALGAFECTVGSELISVSEGTVSKLSSNRIEYKSVSYASGVVKEENCTTAVGDGGVTPGDGIYTFVVDATIDGLNFHKVYYVALGSTDADASRASINESLNVLFPPAQEGEEKEPPAPAPTYSEEDDMEEFVEVSCHDGVGATITPNPGVSILRVLISGDCSEEVAGTYMPLKKFTPGDTVPVLHGKLNGIKVLVKAGSIIKEFEYLYQGGTCTKPVVVEYCGAVGVYSRGLDYDYMAYAKGRYDSLNSALAAEVKGETAVYYIPVDSEITNAQFGAGETFTFFFNSTETPEINETIQYTF